MINDSSTYKSGVKIAWILVAMGLILGGIAGINQDVPPSSADGWVYPYNELSSSDDSIMIDDVNQDGINDLFYWINPHYNSWEENTEKVQQQTQTAIIDGATGELIRYKAYSDPQNWTISTHLSTSLFRTADNDVIALASVGIPHHSENQDESDSDTANIQYSYEINDDDINQFHLLHIDIATLEIDFRLNVSSLGEAGVVWDSSNLNINYLGNNSQEVPDSTYSADVLVIENIFEYPGEDVIKVMDFINPDTLEPISQITWNDVGPFYYNISGGQNISYEFRGGFCRMPTNELQNHWKYPYYYMYYVDRNAPNSTAFFLAKLSQLRSGLMNETSNTWLFYNTTLFDSTDPDILEIENIWERNAFVSFNATGDPTGITHILQAVGEYDLGLNTKYREEYPSFNDGDPNMEETQMFRGIKMSQIVSFNIQNQQKTFEIISFKEGTFSDNRAPPNSNSEWGVCVGIIPITFGGGSDQTTSFALIFSKQDPRMVSISEMQMPVVAGDLFFLSDEYAGVTVNSSVLSLLNIDPISFECPNLFDIFYNSLLYESSADAYNFNTGYDVDGDGNTDILIAGIYFQDSEFLYGNNGPYFTITQKEVINQSLYMNFESEWYIYNKISPLTDADGDGIGDLLLENRYVIFNREMEILEQSELLQQATHPATQGIFITGAIMLFFGLLVLVLDAVLLRKTKINFTVPSKKRFIIMAFLAVATIGLLYFTLIQMINNIESSQSIQFGQSPEQIAITNFTRNSGLVTFTFFSTLFISAGLYVLLAPRISSWIILLNQIFHAKKEGFKAVKRKVALDDQALEDTKNIKYKMIIIPPFGRNTGVGGLISRILSIIALILSVGLMVFDYTNQYFNSEMGNIAVITGFTDSNFIGYIGGFFLYLIIPGLIAVPFFFWLIPTSWLLDDAGILFYTKDLKSTKPEDVESVGGWFSNYLKGFLGIGAIFSYIRFIQGSPILASIKNFPSDVRFNVLFFIFGFCIIAGFACGVLAVTMHELTLSSNVSRLYHFLDQRNFDIHRKEIVFNQYEELSEEVTLAGYKKE